MSNHVIQLGTDGSQSISVPGHMFEVAKEIVRGIPAGTPNRRKLILSAITRETEYDAKVSAIEAEGVTRSDAQGIVDAEERFR